MDKNLTKRVAAVVGVLAVGLIVSFYWPASSGSSPEIVLPQTGSADIDVDVGREEYNRRVADEVVIDEHSVQRVVASLRRPDEYTFTGQTTLYYGDQSSTVSVRGAVRGELTKVVQSMTDNLYKHTILTASEAYIWSSDTLSYYSGARGDFTVDELAIIPTYEDLLALPEEEITGGGFETVGETACIYAECQRSDGITVDRYYISVVSGLLVRFQSYENSVLVCETSMIPLIEAVDDDWFMLPSGSVVTGS